MIGAQILSLAALAALAPVSDPARACILDTPICKVGADRFAKLAHPDLIGKSAVVFEEYGFGDDPARKVYLVACGSRNGVVFSLQYDPTEAEYAAQEYLVDLVLKPRSVRTSAVIDRLAKMGVAAERASLPAEHCGCDLVQMKMELDCAPDQ